MGKKKGQRFLKREVKSNAGTRENRNATHLLENINKVWSCINTCKELKHGVIKERSHSSYKLSCQFFSFNLESLTPDIFRDT